MKGFIDGEYPYFDNCDAINVNRTQNIPMDYEGLMGVPITFLHRFNPKQFQIVRFRKGDDDKDLSVGGKSTYFRILIKRLPSSDFVKPLSLRSGVEDVANSLFKLAQ